MKFKIEITNCGNIDSVFDCAVENITVVYYFPNTEVKDGLTHNQNLGKVW